MGTELVQKQIYISQKDLFRLAASLYSETSDVFDADDSLLLMIECLFLENENDFLKASDITEGVSEKFHFTLLQEEAEKIISKSNGIFQTIQQEGENAYQLTKTAFEQLNAREKNNIQGFIDEYISCFCIANKEKCTKAIYQYLYELTTTNINSYMVLFNKGINRSAFSEAELSIDMDSLDEEERELVHNFIEWDNAEKNIALGNIVFCCLEYCLVVNGDSPNKLLRSTNRKRDIYLDTNIIFRALGINGIARQKAVQAFLQKCKQAKIDIIISYHSKIEFFDTVNHIIESILAHPHGRIMKGAYEELSDYSLFSYYEEWRKSHKGNSLIYFKKYIEAQYTTFVSKYSIKDAEKIPKVIYDSDSFKAIRNQYSHAISEIKNKTNIFWNEDCFSSVDGHDASLVLYTELLRKESKNEKDIFVVSSDKMLRYWDMTRTDNDFPVVIYPSQLFLLLLKLCGRSSNDFSSFVSFINIKAHGGMVSPMEANTILSGISSITEDVKVQQDIVAQIYEGEFRDTIRNANNHDELYKQFQEITQHYLEEQLKEQETQLSAAKDIISEQQEAISDKEEKIIESKTKIAELTKSIVDKKAELKEKDDKIGEADDTIKKKNESIDKHKQSIYYLAKKQTMFSFYLKYLSVPIALLLLWMSFAVFIICQFVGDEKDPNFAIEFILWLKNTWIGTKIGEFVYTVDFILAAVLFFLSKIYYKSNLFGFFRRQSREKNREEAIKKYIKDNKLYDDSSD